MPPECDPLAAQHALAAWIRDPRGHPPPPGVEPRRLQVYAELFHRNVSGLLAATFPVIRATLGDEAWQALVRDFLREHPTHTPLFTELPRELLRYLDTRAQHSRGDPPWLGELAHYEWVELALQVSEARNDDTPHDPHGDLLAGVPLLSPLAWPLGYAWPVHRIGPGHVPDAPPSRPTLLLVRRDADGAVRFDELSPLAFRLLHMIEEAPMRSGLDHLQALAGEASADDPAAFVKAGARMLALLRANGTLAGTRTAT